ncbi:hypothetical protein [Nocardiopsis sp. CNS-639]|uniref:hypothetical protein n=1 Tax=Nocardiopsis sp. CNS-639 TaxID=1169153 RepID=UPI000360DB1A|nr:hypothetical protein [Nocardiopsis sp. CNS-639]
MTTYPMPEQMAHLPRVHGTPVPWTAQWSSGTEHVVERENGPVLVCTCRIGKGRPRFGNPCANRQRQAVAERRCSVCGTPISAKATCAWTVADTATRYYVEPPAHLHCLLFALQACPKLASIAHRTHVVQAVNYTVFERRAVSASPEGGVFELVPFGEPSAGVVELYALAPVDPLFTTAAVWLADQTENPW